MKQANVILQHLSIGYHHKRHPHMVAEGLCASLKNGELTCLIGANGTGKSTLLKTMAGFLAPLSGSIRISIEEGEGGERGEGGNCDDNTAISMGHLSVRQKARIISVVLTTSGEPLNLTVEETVGLGRSPYTNFWGTLTEQDKETVDQALRQTGAEHLKGRTMHTLSDGERQKVMTAKALAQQTPIIYLDEPTAFLDYPSKVELLQMFSQLAHNLGKTILLSTHDVELALQLADRLWLMQPGRLVTGTPQELADNGTLSQFIERPGIAFDKENMTIRVEKPTKEVVPLQSADLLTGVSRLADGSQQTC